MKTYFATQIYQNKLAFDLKDLRHEIELIKKSDRLGQAWSKKNYHKGYTSYGSLDHLHRFSSTFENLEKKINIHVTKFLKQLKYTAKIGRELAMTDCWVNIMPSGALHYAHLHPRSVISGTFYVTSSSDASAIQFEDPRLGLFMNSPANAERFVSLQPKSADIVLFESWLKHGVPINKSKEPRISISFNYAWL